MKRKYLSFILLPFILLSCSKKVELTPVNIEPYVLEDKNVTYIVNPKVELFFIACSLADIPFYSYVEDNNYLTATSNMFEKFKDHALVKQLKSLSKDFQGSVTSQLGILEYISDDLTTFDSSLDKKNLPSLLKSFWGKANLQEFLTNFNDFAIQSNFARIWGLYKTDLKLQLTNIKEFYNVNNQILPWIEQYFFESNTKVKYIITSAYKMNSSYLSDIYRLEDDTVVFEIYQHPYIYFEGGMDITICMAYTQAVVKKVLNDNWDEISAKCKETLTELYNQNKIDSKKFEDEVFKSDFSYILQVAAVKNFIENRYEPQMAGEFIDAYFNNDFLSQVEYTAFLQDYSDNREDYKDFEEYFNEKKTLILDNSN